MLSLWVGCEVNLCMLLWMEFFLCTESAFRELQWAEDERSFLSLGWSLGKGSSFAEEGVSVVEELYLL